MVAALIEDLRELSRDWWDILDLSEYVRTPSSDHEHVACKAKEFIKVVGSIYTLSNQDII